MNASRICSALVLALLLFGGRAIAGTVPTYTFSGITPTNGSNHPGNGLVPVGATITWPANAGLPVVGFINVTVTPLGSTNPFYFQGAPSTNVTSNPGAGTQTATLVPNQFFSNPPMPPGTSALVTFTGQTFNPATGTYVDIPNCVTTVLISFR